IEVRLRIRCKNRRPRAIMIGVLSSLVEVGSLIRRCFALAKPAESVIHADQDSGSFRVGVEETTPNRTGKGEYSYIVRADVHVVSFQKRRPAPREHPFNAATGRPA